MLRPCHNQTYHSTAQGQAILVVECGPAVSGGSIMSRRRLLTPNPHWYGRVFQGTMPPSATDLGLSLAWQLLPRSKPGRLPIESCPVSPRRARSVPWVPMRRSSRTLTNRPAGYLRRSTGRPHLWRCGPPQPHRGHSTVCGQYIC